MQQQKHPKVDPASTSIFRDAVRHSSGHTVVKSRRKHPRNNQCGVARTCRVWSSSSRISAAPEAAPMRAPPQGKRPAAPAVFPGQAPGCRAVRCSSSAAAPEDNPLSSGMQGGRAVGLAGCMGTKIRMGREQELARGCTRGSSEAPERGAHPVERDLGCELDLGPGATVPVCSTCSSARRTWPPCPVSASRAAHGRGGMASPRLFWAPSRELRAHSAQVSSEPAMRCLLHRGARAAGSAVRGRSSDPAIG